MIRIAGATTPVPISIDGATTGLGEAAVASFVFPGVITNEATGVAASRQARLLLCVNVWQA